MTDKELLTTVQERTFKYFWEYAHPVSGLARERLGYAYPDEKILIDRSGS